MATETTMPSSGVVEQLLDDEKTVVATGSDTDTGAKRSRNIKAQAKRRNTSTLLGTKSRPDTPQKPADNHKNDYLSLKELFVPKLKLLKILFEVDGTAGWIVFTSIIVSGLTRTWSITVQSDAITAFQEAILSKNFDVQVIFPFLLRRVAVELVQQITIIVGIYGHKRYKKKMERHLCQVLIESQSHLAYPIRTDSDNIRRYKAVSLY
jgi:hypothetical protein